MGGTNAKPPENQQSDRQRGKRYNLDDLPETFRKHYAQVNVFRHATRAQEILVDELSDIVSESSNEDDKKIKRKVDILQELQSARNTECKLLYNSVMELYCNINCIVQDNNLPTFDINSNNQDNSPEFIKLKHAVQLLSSEKKDLEKKNNQLEKIVRLLQSQKETPQQDLSKQRPPKEIGTVQLYHTQSGNTIKDIEADLKEMLNIYIDQVKPIKCHRLDDVDPSKALVILSIITSRVGTDATYAIKDIKNPANTALVLIHIKEDHALPKHASSSILTGGKFQALGGIFDMAFLHGKGIYHCEMNDAALEGIYSFIKQNLEGTNI